MKSEVFFSLALTILVATISPTVHADITDAHPEMQSEMQSYDLLPDLKAEATRVRNLLSAEPTNEIEKFSSDGCSSFPDSFGKYNWQHCCLAHDIAYWAGGPKDLRKVSDDELKQCVSDFVDPALGITMKLGVRVGGGQLTGLNTAPWRWGYGWNYIIGYDNLNAEQAQSVADHFHSVVEVVNRMSVAYDETQREYLEDLEFISVNTTRNFFNLMLAQITLEIA